MSGHGPRSLHGFEELHERVPADEVAACASLPAAEIQSGPISHLIGHCQG